jgi:hypothetical protein
MFCEKERLVWTCLALLRLTCFVVDWVPAAFAHTAAKRDTATTAEANSRAARCEVVVNRSSTFFLL